ncbi:MAG: hypothetical protein M1820_001011 [Bogoriella megaspora]|nr:MAG: hypothetical protein M1820_001011 [Bogoriella megaspora]
MSVTTTANPITTTLLRTLDDYTIHETPSSSSHPSPEALNPNPTPTVSNPPDWPDDYNAIPNYRPVDHTRDMTLRPGGMNPAETVFIFLMMNGVRFNGALAQTWRRTVGRWKPDLFRFAVGGEW